MSPYLDDLQAAGGRNSHTAEILVLYYSRTGATAELALPVCRGVLFGNFCILHVWNEKPELARNVEVAAGLGTTTPVCIHGDSLPVMSLSAKPAQSTGHSSRGSLRHCETRSKNEPTNTACSYPLLILSFAASSHIAWHRM